MKDVEPESTFLTKQINSSIEQTTIPSPGFIMLSPMFSNNLKGENLMTQGNMA